MIKVVHKTEGDLYCNCCTRRALDHAYELSISKGEACCRSVLMLCDLCRIQLITQMIAARPGNAPDGDLEQEIVPFAERVAHLSVINNLNQVHIGVDVAREGGDHSVVTDIRDS